MPKFLGMTALACYFMRSDCETRWPTCLNAATLRRIRSANRRRGEQGIDEAIPVNPVHRTEGIRNHPAVFAPYMSSPLRFPGSATVRHEDGERPKYRFAASTEPAAPAIIRKRFGTLPATQNGPRFPLLQLPAAPIRCSTCGNQGTPVRIFCPQIAS